MTGTLPSMLPMPGHTAGDVLYLSRAEVIAACARIDIATVVADTLLDHHAGRTVLPDEAYLGWQAPDGAAARCLAMPGAVPAGPDRLTLGLKVINGCLSNPARGLARAQGFIVLFDAQTARPVVLMEAAYISAMRTAGVTVATVRHLGAPDLDTVAVLGCGTLARAHLILLAERLPTLKRIRLYDVNPSAATDLAADLRAWRGDLEVEQAGDPRSAVDGARLVVAVTTVTSGYLRHEWLAPGTLVAHVSLDDVLPDVVERADLLVVDDWSLVAADTRRLLGRMYRDGRVLAPDGGRFPDAPQRPARRVDGTLGDILSGAVPGRRSADDIVLSNPFGMSILDVAVAREVYRVASAVGAGHHLAL